MIRSILVPLDGSAFAEHAVPQALGLAVRNDAALRLALVHVPIATAYIDGVPHFDPDVDEGARSHERRYLDAVAGHIDAAGVDVSTDLLDGPVVAVLEGYARETGVDLIVMSTHGRGGLSRAWLGSVADGLIRRSSVPILLVRPQVEAEPAIEPAPPFRTVLVPLDGSALAEEALGYALALGRRENVRYHLLRAVVPIWVMGSPYVEPGMQMGEADLNARLAQAKAYLDRIAGRLRRDDADVETRVLAHPQPAAAILDVAQGIGADLICLATHGRSGVSRLLLGSVSDKVLRGATGPVLLARGGE